MAGIEASSFNSSGNRGMAAVIRYLLMKVKPDSQILKTGNFGEDCQPVSVSTMRKRLWGEKNFTTYRRNSDLKRKPGFI